jgi:hypothetical protein
MIEKEMVFVFVFFLLISFVSAEKMDISIGNNYLPGDDAKFKIDIYDNNNNLIYDKVNFTIQDHYSEVFKEGTVDSGEEVFFLLPENAIKGYWKITGIYKDISTDMLFNIGELEKAQIKLEGDQLIVTNKGNMPHREEISISIGDHQEIAIVLLDFNETKKIRLTAPPGQYKVFISDGTQENTFETEGVTLTGNVIGLERVFEGNFFQKYPLVSLFLVTLLLVIGSVVFLKVRHKIEKKKKH